MSRPKINDGLTAMQRYRLQHPNAGRESRLRNLERVKASSRAWANRNRERARANSSKWQSAHLAKRAEDTRRWRDRHREVHLVRHAAEMRKWRQNNPDAARAIDHNRRAQKRSNGGSFTTKDVLEIYELQRGRCYWCKTKLSKKYHIDHVWPSSRGGKNDRSNIVIACPKCNQSKNAKTPMEFAGVFF